MPLILTSVDSVRLLAALIVIASSPRTTNRAGHIVGPADSAIDEVKSLQVESVKTAASIPFDTRVFRNST